MRPTLRRPRATPVRASTLRALALVAALITGCGSTVDAGPAASATSGPELQVAADARDEVDCDGGRDRTGAGDYVDGGLETVQDDPAAAVQNLLTENDVGAPNADYVVVARNRNRALVTYEVDREVKVAFVVQDGVTDWDGNVGWGVTSYAACDLAEMPPEISDAAGIDVWTDETGARVPTSQVQSYPGPEHCDWQDITFLQLGDHREGQQYLRDADGALARSTRTTYAEQVQLPEDATDSGWRRDGRALWLVPDRSAAYLVDLDEVEGPKIAERWPGAEDAIGCM